MALTEDEIKAAFNEQAKQLEDYLNNLVGSSDPCIICPESGCIVLDFSECNNFDVLVTEDITCMRMVGEGAPGIINFVIPPNTTRHLCGFPVAWGGDGTECDVDLAGGARGSTFGFGHSGSGGGSAGGGMGKPGIPKKNPTSDGSGGGGAGGSGGDCACIPEDGHLTLIVCEEVNCSDTSPKFVVKACGGMPGAGYSWSFTGDGVGTISGRDLADFSLAPPENAGSAVAGDAYVYHSLGWTGESVNICVCECRKCIYGCDDLINTQSTIDNNKCSGMETSHATGVNGVTSDCSGVFNCVPPAQPAACSCAEGLAALSHVAVCTNKTGFGNLEDVRTAQMITDGCEPCGLTMGTAVVTVTDALGTSVSKSVTP